jgi:aminoglycoside phosphotransferase (APT) family kinase protein
MATDPWSPGARADRLTRVVLQSGLPHQAPPELLESYSNDAWLVGDAVLRICWRGDRGRLVREGLVADALPAGIPYPDVVARGETEGFTWLATKRVAGETLERAWSQMGSGARRYAIEQLADIMRRLHGWVPAAELAAAISDRPVGAFDDPEAIPGSDLNPLPIDRALRLAVALAAQPHVDRGLIDEAARQIEDLRGADPYLDEQRTVVHADLHLANIVWDGSGIAAVLDFERVRLAPPDLDLDELVRAIESRRALGVEAAEAEIIRGLRSAYPDLFGHPQLAERLHLYAVTSSLREVTGWPLTKAEAELSPEHPIRQLRRLVTEPSAFIGLVSDLVAD